jgi:hypothetical protein
MMLCPSGQDLMILLIGLLEVRLSEVLDKGSDKLGGLSFFAALLLTTLAF